MNLVYYKSLSGRNYITVSPQKDEDEESVLNAYFQSISDNDLCPSMVKIHRLAEETLPTGNFTIYHGYNEFGNPAVFVVKHNQRRFFLVYDNYGKYSLIVYFYCFTKKSQNLSKQNKKRILDARAEYFNNRGSYKIIWK